MRNWMIRAGTGLLVASVGVAAAADLNSASWPVRGGSARVVVDGLP